VEFCVLSVAAAAADTIDTQIVPWRPTAVLGQQEEDLHTADDAWDAGCVVVAIAGALVHDCDGAKLHSPFVRDWQAVMQNPFFI
jgi:hypothetical protein